jgi:hypothetical protein
MNYLTDDQRADLDMLTQLEFLPFEEVQTNLADNDNFRTAFYWLNDLASEARQQFDDEPRRVLHIHQRLIGRYGQEMAILALRARLRVLGTLLRPRREVFAGYDLPDGF